MIFMKIGYFLFQSNFSNPLEVIPFACAFKAEMADYASKNGFSDCANGFFLTRRIWIHLSRRPTNQPDVRFSGRW